MKAQNYRKGGKVKGPGTGTSDSVPAMLSNGEFVLPQDSVQAIGKPTLDAVVAATHKPVGLAQMANTRPPLAAGLANGGVAYPDQVSRTPDARRTEAAKTMKVATSYDEQGRPIGWRPANGPDDTQGLDMGQLARMEPHLANGGSPWDADYQKGGSLNVASAPASTAPIASAPVPTPLANAAAVAPAAGVPPVGPSVTVPTPAVGPSVTAPVGPSVTAPTYTGSSSTPLQKATDVTSLAGNYANGGAVKRPLAHYANGTPPDELTMIDPTTGTPLQTTYHGDSGLSRAIRNPVGAINSMFGSSAGSDLPQPTPTPEIAAPTPLTAGMPSNSRSMDADGATIPEIDARIGSVPAPKEVAPTPLAAAAIPSLGTTTEEVNRVAGAQNAQARANDQQNNEQRQNRMVLAGQAASDKFDAANAAQAARVSGGSILNAAAPGRRAAGFGEGGGRAMLAEGLAAGALNRANASQSAFNGSPLAGYAQQAMNVQSAGEQAQRAGTALQAGQLANAQGRMGLAQSAQMNPLAVEGAKQGVAQGAIALQQHATEQKLIDNIINAKTPEERTSLLQTHMALRQQPKVAIVDQDTGKRDTMGSPIFKKVAVDTMTGHFYEPTGKLGGGSAVPPQSDIDLLAKNATPRAKALFDEHYGDGAAEKYLGK